MTVRELIKTLRVAFENHLDAEIEPVVFDPAEEKDYSITYVEAAMEWASSDEDFHNTLYIHIEPQK